MSGGQTAADTAIMENTAVKFEQVADGLEKMLKDLMDRLEVLQSGWQGRSGRSFHQVKETWKADQDKLREALRETATAIRTSGRDYTESDHSSGGKLDKISSNVDLTL